jgi:hypothetical protein
MSALGGWVFVRVSSEVSSVDPMVSLTGTEMERVYAKKFIWKRLTVDMATWIVLLQLTRCFMQGGRSVAIEDGWKWYHVSIPSPGHLQ